MFILQKARNAAVCRGLCAVFYWPVTSMNTRSLGLA